MQKWWAMVWHKVDHTYETVLKSHLCTQNPFPSIANARYGARAMWGGCHVSVASTAVSPRTRSLYTVLLLLLFIVLLFVVSLSLSLLLLLLLLLCRLYDAGRGLPALRPLSLVCCIPAGASIRHDCAFCCCCLGHRLSRTERCRPSVAARDDWAVFVAERRVGPRAVSTVHGQAQTSHWSRDSVSR